jgi:HK97 family phage major capsid protein
MGMSKLTELREARQKAHAELTAVLNLPPTQENNDKARKLIEEQNRCKTEIDKIESREASALQDVIKNSNKEVEFRRAFQTYLHQGERTPSDVRETLRLAQRDGIVEGNLGNHIGTYSDMGYFVPTGFVNAVEVATKWYADLIASCGSIGTASASPLPYPTNNDTTAKAVLLGESQAVVEKDVTASQILFGAYKYSSGLVKASIELVQDSAFDIESFVARAMGVRFGREWEDVFTNGNGSTEPQGILTGISGSGAVPVIAQGANANSGLSSDNSTNSIGWADVVNLAHSVDKSYRKGASYMLHDQTLATLGRTLDKFGRPLFVPGLNGDVDRLNGYPVIVNNAMPQVAASNVVLAFGDFSKFMIRRVKDFQILVLRERYADNGQVGYIGFARVDSKLVDAGTHPLNVLQMHS